ncbi:MAG: hypothetical protein QM503_06490 [Bacteroidota bacterium]
MYISNKNIGVIAAALLLYTYYQVGTNLYYVSAIGAALFLFVFIKFVQNLGEKVEVRDLIAFLSLLQWVVGPILAYNLLPYDELYWMDVPEEEYMNFVVSGCAALLIGMYLPVSNDRTLGVVELDRASEYLRENPYVGYIIAGGGLVTSFLSSYVPGSLGFLFFLLGNLQFVGVYMILFGDSKFKWIIFSALMGTVILGSVARGMFGQLMLWLLFSFLMIAYVIKIPMFGKVLLISVGVILILLIQSVKDEYRKATWYATSSKSNSEIFQELLQDRISNPSKLFSAGPLENMGARLNQGWIIARIMGHMPLKYDFVKGETIETAIYAGLLPRVLAPNKAKAGGRANFERFTGTPLPEGTSMDISLVGEAYANYGVFGGVIFMFIIGLFYNWIIIRIVKIAKNHPVLVLFIPLLFFQVIKAETDFATIFNYLTKAALIVYLVFWGMKTFLKIEM